MKNGAYYIPDRAGDKREAWPYKEQETRDWTTFGLVLFGAGCCAVGVIIGSGLAIHYLATSGIIRL